MRHAEETKAGIMSWLRTKPQGEMIFLQHHLCIHVTLGFFRITGIPFGRPPTTPAQVHTMSPRQHPIFT